MNARDDFFTELLPATYSDDDEARALALGMVSEWFRVLNYPHNEATHTEILDSLNWPGMRDFVRDGSLHFQDNPIDFDSFAAGVRTIARRAKAAGLVVENGRARKRSRSGDATGDLFAENGSGEAE